MDAASIAQAARLAMEARTELEDVGRSFVRVAGLVALSGSAEDAASMTSIAKTIADVRSKLRRIESLCWGSPR